jgi:hypothetical protein
MVDIFFKEQANRKKELIFFEYLKRNIPGIKHINDNYPLPLNLLSNQLDIATVILALQNDNKLPFNKKLIIMDALSKLPKQINVARNISSVSVDFVIVNNMKIQYVELHERQHCELTVNRAVPVFDCDNNRFEIPRFAQRILKDIWRWQNLPNYKIVWWDWFEINHDKFHVSSLFKNERIEFYRKDKFGFSELKLNDRSVFS